VLAFHVIELVRAGEGAQHLLEDVPGPTLLQAGVLVDADAGQARHLVAA
jgi:hypothetical protein